MSIISKSAKFYISSGFYTAFFGSVGYTGYHVYNESLARQKVVRERTYQIQAETEEFRKIVRTKVYDQYSRNLLHKPDVKREPVKDHKDKIPKARPVPVIGAYSGPAELTGFRYSPVIDESDQYFKMIDETLTSLKAPFAAGDEISARFLESIKKLEESKDTFPELTYYLAHYSITKMQIASVKERLEKAQFDQSNVVEKALIASF